MTDTKHSPDKPREQLWNLIKDIRFTMLTTRHADGQLHSRPMTTQNHSLQEDESLWFFMPRTGDTVHDLLADPSVNVSYAHPGMDSYVSVSGKAVVREDMERKKLLWSKVNEAWFPLGVDDPNLALVEVSMTHAHYWDVKESKMMQLFEMAKAAITGKPPSLGESGDVQLS